jgi:predicted nucleic acid-binding Zn ribbon protein
VSELRSIADLVRRVGRVPAVDPVVARSREVWADAVGAQVASNSVPVRMSGEAMVVACSSSTWAAELAMLESQLRRRLSDLLAAPAPSLRFEVGAVIREDPPAAPAEPLRAATKDDERRADELAAGVSDEALRGRVREAILLSLRRGS